MKRSDYNCETQPTITLLCGYETIQEDSSPKCLIVDLSFYAFKFRITLTRYIYKLLMFMLFSRMNYSDNYKDEVMITKNNPIRKKRKGRRERQQQGEEHRENPDRPK